MTQNKKFDIDIRLLFEGNMQNFDENYLNKIITDACEKFLGKFGIARLNLGVEKIDQFSGKGTISFTEIPADLLLKFWSAICFCHRPGKITIVDFNIRQ